MHKADLTGFFFSSPGAEFSTVQKIVLKMIPCSHLYLTELLGLGLAWLLVHVMVKSKGFDNNVGYFS